MRGVLITVDVEGFGRVYTADVPPVSVAETILVAAKITGMYATDKQPRKAQIAISPHL